MAASTAGPPTKPVLAATSSSPASLLSVLGLSVTGFILAVLVVEKFLEGGWITLVITGGVMGLCLLSSATSSSSREPAPSTP